jgi:hypothetical protein
VDAFVFVARSEPVVRSVRCDIQHWNQREVERHSRVVGQRVMAWVLRPVRIPEIDESIAEVPEMPAWIALPIENLGPMKPR